MNDEHITVEDLHFENQCIDMEVAFESLPPKLQYLFLNDETIAETIIEINVGI